MKTVAIKRDIPKKDQSKNSLDKPKISRSLDMNKKKDSPKPININRTPNISKNSARDNAVQKMDIREQTVAKRRSAREAKNVNPHSPQINRAPKRAQEYKIKKKDKGAGRRFILNMLLFLLIFIVLASFTAAVFYINLVSKEPFEYEVVRLKLGLAHEIENDRGVIIDTDKYFINDVLYVNMTAIADEFDFVLTGDKDEYRFITDIKTGEEVRFYIGKSVAEVNGDSVNLMGNTFITDDSLFVPAEFFEKYVNGISFQYIADEKNEDRAYIIIARETERNESGRFVEKDIGFKLKYDKATEHLDETRLSVAESNLTYFKTISSDPVDNTGGT